jgi:hypothetical protein
MDAERAKEVDGPLHQGAIEQVPWMTMSALVQIHVGAASGPPQSRPQLRDPLTPWLGSLQTTLGVSGTHVNEESMARADSKAGWWGVGASEALVDQMGEGLASPPLDVDPYQEHCGFGNGFRS